MRNILKSIFISVLPVLSTTVFFFGCYILIFNSKYDLQNISVVIISFTVTFFFARVYIKPLARTSKYLTSYSIPIIIGIIISIIGISNSIKAPYVIASNVLVTIGWLLHLKWYSEFQNRDTSSLTVGHKLPYFELQDLNNTKIESSDFIGHTTIFMFYRGNWCPFCMAQIKEMTMYHDALKDRNVKTVLISPQPIKKIKSLKKRFNIDFLFLVDYKNRASKQLGILSENRLPFGFQILGYDSDTVVPTVLITDPKGTLIFADIAESYRYRPEPTDFIQTID